MAGLFSYLLPESACARLFDPDAFWPTIQKLGTRVDELPGYTPAMMHILWDYLGTECRIDLPDDLSSQYSIARPENLLLIGLFSRHDLAVVRTRIEKCVLRDYSTASSVFEAYAREFEHLPQDQDWLGYLSRQHKHLKTNDSVLVVLCRDSEPTIDHGFLE